MDNSLPTDIPNVLANLAASYADDDDPPSSKSVHGEDEAPTSLKVPEPEASLSSSLNTPRVNKGDEYPSSASEDEEDDDSLDGDDESSVNGDDDPAGPRKIKVGPSSLTAPRVKGELSLADLPPIEDLQISVPHEKVQAIGVIKSFVDPLVVVEGYPNSPALNLDSVLFVEQGDRALGHIFDVFGPVKQPHYCVRFNSKDHVDERGIKPGMTVYCAPATPHSKFVFLAQLEKLKGTDASWLDDVEPPPEAEEFSDDEKERFAKKHGKGRRRKGRQPFDQSVPPNPEEEQSPRNDNSSRKRNFNYIENEGQNPRFPRDANSPYVPSFVPGFMPPPRYPPHPNYFHPHHLHHDGRGGPRRMPMHFRPPPYEGFQGPRPHFSGQWPGFEQPRHYWRPPPITGKPQWTPFDNTGRVPFSFS